MRERYILQQAGRPTKQEQGRPGPCHRMYGLALVGGAPGGRSGDLILVSEHCKPYTGAAMETICMPGVRHVKLGLIGPRTSQ